MNLGVLIVSLFLLTSNVNNYGGVITYETDEWAKGTITDLATVPSLPCPDDYEQLKAYFPGTETVCLSRNGRYTKGSCGKRGSTYFGMSGQSLEKFNGQYWCVKRSDKNYHELVKLRSDNCADLCGSRTDADKQFCKTSEEMICPLNNLTISKSMGNSSKDLVDPWKAYLI